MDELWGCHTIGLSDYWVGPFSIIIVLHILFSRTRDVVYYSARRHRYVTTTRSRQCEIALPPVVMVMYYVTYAIVIIASISNMVISQTTPEACDRSHVLCAVAIYN